jgi:hypothetical protein
MKDWQDVWIDTELDAAEVDVSALRLQAEGLAGSLRRRNALELAAAVLVAVLFGGGAWTAWVVAGDPLAALGQGLSAAGAVLVGSLVALRGSIGPTTADPAEDTGAYLVHHRDELAHQVRLLRWVPVWYLGPLVPGLVVLAVATTHSATGAGTMIAVSMLVFAGIAWLNRLAANQIEAQLEALPHPDSWS